ncbi:hypothetical protein [Ancylobacter oerskovii]|uniref:Uncharacterized protein n=1 Tax=Ancylobacter oerskovii TaxID=459519 RepID=A0ABW4YX32_9HYPH
MQRQNIEPHERLRKIAFFAHIIEIGRPTDIRALAHYSIFERILVLGHDNIAHAAGRACQLQASRVAKRLCVDEIGEIAGAGRTQIPSGSPPQPIESYVNMNGLPAQPWVDLIFNNDRGNIKRPTRDFFMREPQISIVIINIIINLVTVVMRRFAVEKTVVSSRRNQPANGRIITPRTVCSLAFPFEPSKNTIDIIIARRVDIHHISHNAISRCT